MWKFFTKLTRRNKFEHGKDCDIHPTAKIDPTAIIGKGVFIGKDVEIGFKTTIDNYTHISEGTKIGDRVIIEDNIYIKKNVTIENNCFIGQFSKIGRNTFIDEFVNIDGHCDIFENVRILDNTSIGISCTLNNDILLPNDFDMPSEARIDFNFYHDSFISIPRGYKYLATAYKINDKKSPYYDLWMVQLGCYSRLLSEWQENFWNNDREFPKVNKPNSIARFKTFKRIEAWIEAYEKTINTEVK